MTTMTPRFALNGTAANAETAVERARRASRNATLSPSGPEPTVARVLVTPAMAMDWLDNANTTNRKVSDAHVQRLARDMASGEWKLTHEGIAFDPSGILLDGQHRLWAIVESGVSIRMVVARGVPREAALAINTGLTRTLSDNLKIAGEGSYSNTLIAMASVVHHGRRNNRGGSYDERYEIMKRYLDHLQWAENKMPTKRYVRNAIVGSAVARAHMYERDLDRLSQFCEILATGLAQGERDSACIALRNYLIEGGGKLAHDSRDMFLKSMHAIKAFMRGRPLTVVRPVKEEAYPLPDSSRPEARPTSARAAVEESLEIAQAMSKRRGTVLASPRRARI